MDVLRNDVVSELDTLLLPDVRKPVNEKTVTALGLFLQHVTEHQVYKPETCLVDVGEVLLDVHVRDTEDGNLMVQHLVDGELVDACVIQRDGGHRVACSIERQVLHADDLSNLLKALIKPSTEAAKAAEAMGIQFDAAGIRAAGGLDNFLKELDQTINQYAQSTGELSETIYGNLFGSARALRLLTSLTGEQADKFTENIGIMADSAGSIDQAFNEMASTGEAAAQKLKNQFAGITDAIAGIMRPAAPIMAFSANVLITVNSVATLTKTLKALNLTQVLTATRAKASGAAMLLLGLNTNKAAAVQRVFNGALRSGTYAATAFKIALRGLMIATGVGIAIAAVTAIIEAFTNKSEDATEQTDLLAEAEDAFKSKFAEVKTALDAEIKKLET